MPHTIIVVPCYNEAQRLCPRSFARFVRQHRHIDFLFVDDGSKDQTGSILRSLCQLDPDRLGCVVLAKNAGKAEAVRFGVIQALARGPAMVGYWDADLATPLEAIPTFIQVLSENPLRQIVIGSRVRLLGRAIKRRAVRHYLGRLFAHAASLVIRLPVYDTQCGAKLFRVTPETRELFSQPFRTNWIFDVEILARFTRKRSNTWPPPETWIYEFVLSQWRDVAGSKVRPWDFVVALRELLTIYWTYTRPALFRIPRAGRHTRPAAQVSENVGSA